MENRDRLSIIAELLGVSIDSLMECMTHQTINVRGQIVRTHLSRERAEYARDALAKVRNRA